MDAMLEQVQSGDFDPVKMFTGDKQKFLEVKAAIESISNNLTKGTCIEFVTSKIIPTIFNKNVDNTIRDEAIEIGFHLLSFVNISALGAKEQDKLFTSIEETYTKVIGDVRDSNYTNWDKLWIFLIRLCHDKLHTKLSLANKLLRVVEVAFRNSTSIEQRLKAYDCWTELIDNCSLNMNYMCTPKQIKLLVTPMKAKFSRLPVVIIKRCDTFIYLLEKLQNRATLALKEFFEFCFGPFDDRIDLEKTKLGKSVSEVCRKSTTILITILGHTHEISGACVETSNVRLFHPIITDENFENFAEILINSSIESCMLLNVWNKDAPTINTIIKCLWRSLLGFIHRTNDDIQSECLVQISNSLRKLFDKCEKNSLCNVILANIAELLIKSDFCAKLKDILFYSALKLLPQKLDEDCSFHSESLLRFVEECLEGENKTDYKKIAIACFQSMVNFSNADVLYRVWVRCCINISPDNTQFFLWPIQHYTKFDDVENLSTKWMRMYTTESKVDAFKLSLIQSMEKLYTQNPLLGPGLVSFLHMISMIEINPNNDFVLKFMKLIEQILTYPSLDEGDIKKISSIVVNYCDQNLSFYKSESTDEALDKLCGCLERLITIHKDYTILNDLHSRLSQGQPKNLAKFSKRLLSFLESLILNEENTSSTSTGKLIDLLETKDLKHEVKVSKQASKDLKQKTLTPAKSSRSLRIINMVNSNPKTNKPKENKVNLFGKEHTPSVNKYHQTRLKGRRTASKPILNEDKSQDYVKIDTEVKINLDNLNDHQKEMFKRRREDIPALYSELTQSQSRDFFEKIGGKEDSQDKSPTNKRKRKEEEKDINRDVKLLKLDSSINDSDGNTGTDKIEETTIESGKSEDLTNKIEEVISETLETVLKQVVSGIENTDRIDEGGAGEKLVLEDTITQDVAIDDASSGYEKHEENKIITKRRRSRKVEIVVSPTAETSHTEQECSGTTIEHDEDGVAIRRSSRKGKKRISDFVEIFKNRRNVTSNLKLNTLAPGVGVESKDETQIDDTTIENSLSERNSPVKNRRRRKPKPDENETKIDTISQTIDEVLAMYNAPKRKPRKSPKPRKSVISADIEDALLQDGNQNQIDVASAEKKDVVKQKKTERKTLSKNLNEVYVFKADENSPKQESIKRTRSPSKKIAPFNRSDYTKKKRRFRKDQKQEDGFPFHVTADSGILPLSRSQSLRAVASPEESETITILITRSPPIAEGKGAEEGVKKCESSNEDIIEETQDVEVMSERVEERNKRKLHDSPKVDEATALISGTQSTVTGRRLSLTELSTPMMVSRCQKRAKSLEELDICTSIIPEFIVKPEKVEDEPIQTETLTLTSSKPPLPTSPITCDTPDRTIEFLNNTLDISPITANDDVVLPRVQPEVSNLRVARLLQMVNTNVQVKNEGRKWFGNRHSSPSSSKVRRMKLKKEENCDILTFSRDVPSPLTTPASGILKRKLEDSYVPSPKRKRVNFSDPATTAKKIFIKDSDEYNDSPKDTPDLSSMLDEDPEGGNDDANLLALHLETLKIPDIVQVITQYLSDLSPEKMAELVTVLQNQNCGVLLSKCIVSYAQNENNFKQFSTKFFENLRSLSSDKLEHFVREFVEVFGEGRISGIVKEQLTEKQVEDHIINANCDKMKGLIRKFVVDLEDDKKSEFLVELMELASGELTPNKNNVNLHVEVLNKFVQRMSD